MVLNKGRDVAAGRELSGLEWNWNEVSKSCIIPAYNKLTLHECRGRRRRLVILRTGSGQGVEVCFQRTWRCVEPSSSFLGLVLAGYNPWGLWSDCSRRGLVSDDSLSSLTSGQSLSQLLHVFPWSCLGLQSSLNVHPPILNSHHLFVFYYSILSFLYMSSVYLFISVILPHPEDL